MRETGERGGWAISGYTFSFGLWPRRENGKNIPRRPLVCVNGETQKKFWPRNKLVKSGAILYYWRAYADLKQVSLLMLRNPHGFRPAAPLFSVFTFSMGSTSSLGLLFLSLSGLSIITLIDLGWNLEAFFTRIAVSPPSNGSRFEFVVVGSGSAGSVVAGRLSEAGHRVLLLEAGGRPSWLLSIPAFAPWFLNSRYDWAIATEPGINSSLAVKDRRLLMSMGKVLGGGSSTNFMIHSRGNRQDYDGWEEAGNPGWGYEQVLEYFKKSESFSGSGSKLFRGTRGSVGVQETGCAHPVGNAVLDSFKEIGHEVGDINGELNNAGGFFERDRLQVTQSGGFRKGTYKGYVEESSSVEVVTHATATKIVLSETGHRAEGVVVSRFGEEISYFADKEVIVCSGAVGSPKLLMLSGIGPKKHLEDLEIPVVKEIPGVGRNLQGHPMVVTAFHTSKPGLAASPFAIFNPLNYFELFLHGTGPLTKVADNYGTVDASGRKKDSRPDVQLMGLAFDLDLGGPANLFGFDELTWEDIERKHLSKSGGTSLWLMAALLRPKSRGSVALASRDPMDDAVIDEAHLRNPEDVKVLVEALKLKATLERTEAFSSIGLRPFPSETLHCGRHEPGSDSHYECLVRHYTVNCWHPAGTCKMGPESDPGAVVDNRLRV